MEVTQPQSDWEARPTANTSSPLLYPSLPPFISYSPMLLTHLLTLLISLINTQVQALLNEQKALVAAVTTAERNKQTQVKLAEEAYQQRIAEAASAAEEMQVTPLVQSLHTTPFMEMQVVSEMMSFS